MCPVCQARFRGATECSRCGADLRTIMRLAVSAWRMREAARDAIAAGDAVGARALVVRAQEICGTPAGAPCKHEAAARLFRQANLIGSTISGPLQALPLRHLRRCRAPA